MREKRQALNKSKDGDPLTQRQEEVLFCIVRFKHAKEKFPTMRELMAELGIKNINTLIGFINALRRKGWIDYHPGEHRGFEILRHPKDCVEDKPVAVTPFGSFRLRIEQRDSYSLAEARQLAKDIAACVDSMNVFGK